jgi:photosystem II stability/assembly factor-like uncharacterized protein
MRQLPAKILIAVAISSGYLDNAVWAQQVQPEQYQGLSWRHIGPFRGGRTVGAEGVPSQANVFYIGVNNGGVWKTTDYGHTWFPIFDQQSTGSIGDIAVARSNPNTVYVGSGEGLHRPDLSTGNGMYRSDDAGATWKHLGLRDAQQIGKIIVDPNNHKRLFVAALGHPYGANSERGVYRSTDGGETFEKVLYKDEHTGAIGLAMHPSDSNTLYATLWHARQGPWENGAFQGPNSGVYKSTDGGNTWTQLRHGLPDKNVGRINISIAPSDPNRLYAQVNAAKETGTYRSDDAGDHWYKINSEERVSGRPDDFAEIQVHPNNPDILYSANVATQKSEDGGKTWTAVRGAPGGDDYHRLWINPNNPDIILNASDQGAIITVNGGQTWSSWYNQPTAQFYHVSTDNRFPYRVYGGQQESGSAAVKSRGDNGQITFRDWQPVGVEEYGYVAPDPLHPGVIFGGKITRFDEATGQTQDIAPQVPGTRFLRTAPVLFSPVDKRTLYYAGNVLFKTTDYGHKWQIISPDLSRKTWEVPANVAPYQAEIKQRGVIYTVAPSPLDINKIWVGTDDGLLHRTDDGGKRWHNLTPPNLPAWAKVSLIEASHFDKKVAYAAINTLRLDQLRPVILRTRNDGKTWSTIVNGIPDGETVNAVREDPKSAGLLYAATERTVYFSVDDGEHWASLRQNLPITSIRDLVIQGDDLVIGTHGRGFWILDDISPIRQLKQLDPKSTMHLFAPQLATRVRWNMNTDTPLPPEEPAGANPPDGAIVYFQLKQDATDVALEIRDDAGRLVRRYHSSDAPEPIETGSNVPVYWQRPAQILPRKAGMHRFIWDLHYSKAVGQNAEFPIAAIYKNTVRTDLGPWAMPGKYQLSLIVDGKTSQQSMTIRMDPRVTTSKAALQQQFDLSLQLRDGMNRIHTAAITPERKALHAEMDKLMSLLQGADNPPTQVVIEKSKAALLKMNKVLSKKE